MLGPDATHLFHLHYFVFFSSFPPLYPSTRGSRTWVPPHSWDSDSYMAGQKISLKLSKPWNELHQHSEANRPRERKVEFWWIGSGAIFAPSNSTQRVRSCRQRQLDGRCTALLGRFLAAEILPARAFVSLKLPQLFSGDASIHI